MLWAKLFKTPSAKSYIEENISELGLPEFHEYITALCNERGEVPERVINRAGIERAFGHQLFRGTRNPSRDTVLMLAFGFEENVEAAQRLLRCAGASPLYPRIKRDAAVCYCLEHSLSITDTQLMLEELGLPLIGGVK